MAWFDVDTATAYVAIRGKGLGPRFVPINSTVQLAADDRNAVHGGPLGNNPITWSSADTDVATVSSDGLVTPKKLGNVIITATDGTFTDTIEIVVQRATLGGVLQVDANPTFVVGATEGDILPVTKDVPVTNAGVGAIVGLAANIAYVDGSGWLAAAFVPSSAPSVMTLTADPTGLVAGEYVANVTISSTTPGVAPLVLSVHFLVATPI